MTYDGPEIFRAPYGNEAALSNFRRTVLNGVRSDDVVPYTERDPAGEIVRLWGTKESVEGSWKNVEADDYLIFYRDGMYTHAARVLDTEKNSELGRNIWPNYEEGSPWICIIYLDEPNVIDVESSEIHDLAGYDIDYPMGFSPLNEMGVGGIRGRYGSVKAFASGSSSGPRVPDIDVRESPTIRIPEGVLSDLHFPDRQASEITSQINSALNAGKHVVLTGPPGTGKTEIARRICEHLADEYDSTYTGYQMTTATADWSTFETVGGYMPDEEGSGDLQFQPGQVLRRFKRDGQQHNEPLVVDEINRADIDKAFGQLFTLLSGQSVQLPYKRAGREIEILRAEEFAGELEPHEYVMPASWRLFATMNSYDKTSLYELSYAFMRRFAFVHVGVPEIPDDADSQIDFVRPYADVWNLDPDPETLLAAGEVWYAANTAVEDRKIGPAIVKDVLTHVINSSADRESAFTQAVANYIYPQLEGVPRRERIVNRIASTDHVDGARLRGLARDVLGVTPDE